MNQSPRPRTHGHGIDVVSGPVVVTLFGSGMARVGLCAAALALIVLPAFALLSSGGSVGSPTLVDQQLDGIVQAGSVAPTNGPAFIPAANVPLPPASTSGPAGEPPTRLTVLGPSGSAAPIASSASLPGSPRGIPLTVLAAYRRAANLLASSDPQCGLPWWVLAGIGRIESGHAAGGHVGADGTTIGRIVGPRLDGTTQGTGIVLDTDHGLLDGDPLFDRAVGPMQFLPSTWEAVASDGNADGRMDPNNVYDATLGAARYLCGNGARLGTNAGLTAAVLKYNHSPAYVAGVLSWGRAYRDGVTPEADVAGPIPTATMTATRAVGRPAAPRHAAGSAGDSPSPSPATTDPSAPTSSTTTSSTSTTSSSACTQATGPAASTSTPAPSSPPTTTASSTSTSPSSSIPTSAAAGPSSPSPPSSGPARAC